MTNTRECVESIVDMGFTELEAEVYVFLLQSSPATGYRVAKELQRSFTTIYKALASLEDKGAILVDEGESRLSRPVPLDELLDQIEVRFRERRRRAGEAGKQLPRVAPDARIYQLSTVAQVYERSRGMLEAARERVLLELFPEPLAALRESVESAAARGIDVTARIYEPAPLAGARVVLSPFGAETLEAFRSEWLSVFVDGRQCLLGSFAKSGATVLQAMWSESPILARSLYDYVNSDLHHYAFRPILESATSLEEARAAYAELQKAFPPGGDLGFRELRESIENNWPQIARSPDKEEDDDTP
jgi:sugar-specific transcriptional regulator TrmB